MINLAARMSAIKTVTAEGLILGVVDIDNNNIHMVIVLIKQDIMVVLQVVIVLSSEIRCFEIILSIIYLVCCLVIPIINIKCLLILYHILF